MDKEDEEQIIREMQSPDPAVRCFAMFNCSGVKDPRAVPILIAALKNGDRIAADALGKIGDTQAVPALIEALEATNEWLRYAAARALGNLWDPSAVPALISALNDDNSRVRVAVVYALGEIGDAQAGPGLMDALLDEDPDVRQGAGEALEKMGKNAVPVLIGALRHEVKDVRETAAKLLIKSAKAADLSKIAESLQAYVDSVKKRGNDMDLAKARRWSVEAYKRIADAVSEKRREEMGYLKVPFKRPKTGKKMYRMRRAVNG